MKGLVLAGGSVYGLDAAGAVVAALGAAGRGYVLAGGLTAPVVPAAILFDLANGLDAVLARLQNEDRREVELALADELLDLRLRFCAREHRKVWGRIRSERFANRVVVRLRKHLPNFPVEANAHQLIGLGLVFVSLRSRQIAVR